MNKLKMAACGIDCNECGQYKVTMEQDLKAAESLVEWFRGQEWIGKNDTAEAVLKKAPLCRGCWDKNNANVHFSAVCANCGFRTCCEEKRLNHCGECGSYPCEKYNGFAEMHKAHEVAMEYLLSLKANQ